MREMRSWEQRPEKHGEASEAELRASVNPPGSRASKGLRFQRGPSPSPEPNDSHKGRSRGAETKPNSDLTPQKTLGGSAGQLKGLRRREGGARPLT